MNSGTAAAQGAARGELTGFLMEALASLATRRLVLPVLLLTFLLTASNIVIVLYKPAAGEMPWQFVTAAAARLIGLLAGVVAILRILGDSPRHAWRPDGAFWAYALTMLLGIAVTAAVRVGLVADPAAPASVLVSNLATTLVGAPFAAWFAAIAIERPLAWRPGPWMRGFRSWLPHVLFWSVLLVTPMALLHASLDVRLMRGAGDWFWPISLFDGPLSVAMALLSLALATTAYRRIARS